MKFLVRLTAFCFGWILMICLGFLYSPRQEVSGAYWLLENDTTPYPAVLYRMLPDGRMKTPIMTGQASYYYIVRQPNDTYFFYVSVNMGYAVQRIHIISGELNTVVGPYQAEIIYPFPNPQSPDGEHMVFGFYGGEPPNRIIRTDGDGANAEIIYEGELNSFGDFIWAPDSQWVYFSANDGGRGIYRISTDGTHLERLISNVGFYSPEWIMDGERLIFSENRVSDGYTYWQMNADGSGFEWLFDLPSAGTDNNSFVVEDDLIAVLPKAVSEQAIFIINITTRDARQLTPYNKRISTPVLCDDDKWLVFVATENDEHSVYRVRLDGTSLRRLYTIVSDDYRVSLSCKPDEHWVVFSYVNRQELASGYRRVQINMVDKHIERLPDNVNAPLVLSPLIDLPLHQTNLFAAAVGLILLPVVVLPMSKRLGQR